MNDNNRFPRLPWIILFIVSGACLLHVQPYHLRGWRGAFNIQGPGGWIGYRFADEDHGIFRNALGPVGSLILLVGIYATTLILVTGLRPIYLIRETVAATRRASLRLREWRLRRQAFASFERLNFAMESSAAPNGAPSSSIASMTSETI